MPDSRAHLIRMRIRRAQRFDEDGNLKSLNASLALADFRYVLYASCSMPRALCLVHSAHTRARGSAILCHHLEVVFCDELWLYIAELH